MGVGRRVRKLEGNMLICLLMGRSVFWDHHTNATFWRDSNGKVFGIPERRVTKRHHRAAYKNVLISLGCITGFIGGAIVVGVLATVVSPLLPLGLMAGLALYYGWWKSRKVIRKWRQWHETKGVIRPLGKALSSIPDVGEEDMEKAIHLEKGWLEKKSGELGYVTFPEAFHANEGQQEAVNRLISSRLPRAVELKWNTKVTPIRASIIVARELPKFIPFTDKLTDLAKCKHREYVAGYPISGKPYVMSHDGEFAMKGYSMNPGTGKTTMLRCMVAQILHNDPKAQVWVWDTKRISLAPFRDVPGVRLFNNPRDLEGMWKGWHELKLEMDRRYEEKEANPGAVFDDIYAVLEEGNDFAVRVKALWDKSEREKEKSKSMRPSIWYEIAEVLFQGRELGIFVIAVEQNFQDRFFGGLSLRAAFNTIGMAGFKPQAFRAINGISPSTPYQSGQGRICIVEGEKETWIQGLYGEPEQLVEYAMANRRVTT